MTTIRRTFTRGGAALAGCAVALAVVASGAGAANTDLKPPAQFKATLTGSQVTTWDFLKPNDPNDPCDISAEGHGDQTLKFSAPSNLKLLASRPPKGNPNFFNTHGLPVVLTQPADLRGKIVADRNGEFTSHPEDVDRNLCSGDNGGGVPPTDPAKSDCGVRNGSFYINTDFFTDDDVDELFVPLPGGKKSDKNRLTLSGSLYNWADVAHGTYSSSLDNTYEQCPFELENRAERDGVFYASDAKLSEKDLFNTRKKKLTVSGSVIAKVGSGYTSGKTILAWNLKLTRIK
jgi:hypothetical protein